MFLLTQNLVTWYTADPHVTTCPGLRGFSWPHFSSNSNTEASWPEGGKSPSFVNWSRSSEYNRSGLMTRRGMATKNVGLSFRNTLNPARHFGCPPFNFYHELISRGSNTRIGCQMREPPKLGSTRPGLCQKLAKELSSIRRCWNLYSYCTELNL